MLPKKTTALGESLRRMRRAKGFTIIQLAAMIGMEKSAVHRIETSSTSNPQLHTLQKVAGALGVSVADLVKDVPVVDPIKSPD